MRLMQVLMLLISATVMACSGGGSNNTISNSPTQLSPGQSITLVSGQTINVPSGATVQFPNSGGGVNTINGDYDTVKMTSGALTINGNNNTVNTTAGAVVSVPTSATGPANNTVVAVLSATLSADQAVFESCFLSPSVAYEFHYLLPITGMPENGTNYFEANYFSISASPLTNGTQQLNSSALTSIANTLSVITPKKVRYIVNGQIYASSFQKVSYQGTGVRYDTLAADGITALCSDLRSNYSIVPLTGTVVSAPTDLAHALSLLFYNPSLLTPSATWKIGAAYMKFTATTIGDTYEVLDWDTTTTGNTPSPVATNSTITTLMTSGGIVSSSDGITYNMTNGNISIINGINTYIATTPIINETGTRYRTFYELNGNVYAGVLLKDGSIAGGMPFYVAAPGTPSGYTKDYSPTYQIRLNKIAIDSLKSAVTF
ncbi:hypothetical protein F6V25_14195 [Oryzomonas japonica]|uniref:Uncharacterized protein n=1 Tax=Oryzomonas japonica TaxID=2603858 RepID=A0A7J4ZN16_9BACT|nr:hypothetical protein [Oryzomonas japonica]KAB0663962.1 hypothetical protein F6V25_14195 [Oryzomonas japonica]